MSAGGGENDNLRAFSNLGSRHQEADPFRIINIAIAA
ncbi:hypothetical protein JOF42_000517 [Microbacterium phyllosphaerae]|uniref:Uncharacterized protein n=1 Tax=Microbacterium phyllosphaerae TaxID=124798 RepID=A0ABS4WLE6_9MICO|nr:hypothetical protein [Microbacterium phyllosphaerae]